MRYSVQMYQLTTEAGRHFILRDLHLNIPLACKNAKASLEPLSGIGLLEIGSKALKANLNFDSETYAITLKANGQRYVLQTDDEYTRLQGFSLKSWINLLQSRQSNTSAQHQAEIASARSKLRDQTVL